MNGLLEWNEEESEGGCVVMGQKISFLYYKNQTTNGFNGCSSYNLSIVLFIQPDKPISGKQRSPGSEGSIIKFEIDETVVETVTVVLKFNKKTEIISTQTHFNSRHSYHSNI